MRFRRGTKCSHVLDLSFHYGVITGFDHFPTVCVHRTVDSFFEFATWEQSGRSIPNESGADVNPPDNFVVTEPLDLIVRYTTAPTDIIPALNVTTVTNENRVRIDFDARADWNFSVETSASLSGPWQLHTDFGSSNVSRRLQSPNPFQPPV